ncbi:hypothetical protein B0T09DRAFT_268093 [Sordaria sp. MPI-SDFR-AT-0083]|nr:hypothetical protein B0T09DRAFT_268093 [Sordaria sp. MPI-SDFR-AT-0083]
MVVGTPKFLASLALLFFILRPNVQRSPAPSPDFPILSLISIVLPSNSPAATAAAASSLAVQRSSKNLFSQLLDLLTLGLWSKLGRLSHYAFDAVLLSAFLAGMKRSTGLTLTFGDYSFKTDKVAGENKEVGKWVDKYLGVGEWVMDQSVAIAGSSGWFDRTR